MSDMSKTVVSFCMALLASCVLGLILSLIHPALVLTAIPIAAWVLVAGLQRNGELENAIGGIFGQMTSWVIPAGVSWWVPKPIGQALRKTSTETRTLDCSLRAGKTFKSVRTRDGAIVEIGVVMLWKISNLPRAVLLSADGLAEEVSSILDRGIRYFALSFDSDEGCDPQKNSALSVRKKDFSLYLAGIETVDLDGKIISNDVSAKLALIGVTIVNVDVVDVMEPAEVQAARNAAAAENGQATAEKRDISSMRSRILELMWGTDDTATIETMVTGGKKPLMTEREATTAVRTARGDVTEIYVGGDAGDFTKGQAVSSPRLPTKPKGKK